MSFQWLSSSTTKRGLEVESDFKTAVQRQAVTLWMSCVTLRTYSAVTGSVLHVCSANLLHRAAVLFMCMCVFASPGPVHSAV